MKRATGRRVDRAGNFTDQSFPLPVAKGRHRTRYGCKQGLCIRMCRQVEYLITRRLFDNSTQIHDGDSVADVFHHREIVRYQHERDPGLVAEVSQEIDDLCLHRNIECRHRFVTDNELGSQGNRTCNANALTLTT